MRSVVGYCPTCQTLRHLKVPEKGDLGVCASCASLVRLIRLPAEAVVAKDSAVQPRPVSDATLQLIRLRGDALTGRDFTSLLGVGAIRLQDLPLAVSLGRTSYWGEYHPENRVAGETVMAAAIAVGGSPRYVTDGALDLPLASDLILIGGPDSTRLTEIALEYEGSNRFRLQRRDPVIPLKYWQSSDIAEIARFRVGWRMRGVGAYATYGWPFFKKRDDSRLLDTILPEVSQETLRVAATGEEVPCLRSNYLLITRIPNILHPGLESLVKTLALDQVPTVTNIDGGNGLGTAALALLGSGAKVDCVSGIGALVRDAPFFQAFFKVSGVEHTGEFDRATSITLEDVVPIELDEHRCLVANRQALARLANNDRVG